jgi:hypothetical protein
MAKIVGIYGSRECYCALQWQHLLEFCDMVFSQKKVINKWIHLVGFSSMKVLMVAVVTVSYANTRWSTMALEFEAQWCRREPKNWSPGLSRYWYLERRKSCAMLFVVGEAYVLVEGIGSWCLEHRYAQRYNSSEAHSVYYSVPLVVLSLMNSLIQHGVSQKHRQ